MTTNLSVAQFNTFPYGGAATAAKRLHRSLRQNRIDSRFYFHRNEKSPPADDSFGQLGFDTPQLGIFTGAVQRRMTKRRQRDIYESYNNHIALRPAGAETFSMAELPEPTKLNWNSINADVAHLHWISFFADYPTFFGSIPDHVPIVWTLHDMNAFTGGCHYSNGCTKFKFGCGGCEQLTNRNPRDVSATSFNVKRKSLKNKDVHVVTPSDWMRELAMQSKIWPDNTTFQTIRLGFDLAEFNPIQKSIARQKLGLGDDSVLIGFGAEDINNRRKGLQHLLPALSNLNTDKKVECVVFGSGKIEQTEGLPPIHNFGYVNSAEQQSLIYSAADMVVVPSREDNQPQVGLEAMACGTPVVAFNAGGIPEYVRDGATGLLAKIGDEQELAERIRWMVENELARSTMGDRARLMMEQEFELGAQSKKYLSLYQSIAQSKQLSRAA